ncbi:MAG: SufD family Fe-S cluster assembly protein [Candidatus Sungiibacteriota bacterium]
MSVLAIFMIIRQGEEKEIRIDARIEQEEIKIQEQGSARVFIADNEKLALSVMLSSRGASAVIIGRFLGTQDARQEIILRVIMSAPDTKCRIDFRAALADQSASFFDGMIRVEEQAKNATGFLSYKALLLSSGARAKPIPRLEVLTKEVASLGHAASVGKIDEDQLFYLQSRGIPREAAENLIIEGFLSQSPYSIINGIR